MNRTKTKISGMIPHGFKAEKCKVSLRMAMSRMKLLRNKREVRVKQMRRDVAQLLQTGQDQTARIRVEHVIREEKTMAAYELLELYCELIVARLPIIDSQKTCPIDLQEAISSLIFASPRCADVQELMDVRKQFLTKYGKEFTTAALELRPDCGVSHMIIEKLSAKAPDTETKIKTLKSIAEEHGVEWDSKALLDELQKSKNDLLMGSTQFPSASQVTMGHSATSSVSTSTPPRPTQFLSASQVAMGNSATNSNAGIDQTSSAPKPTHFLSASDVTMEHPDFNSSTSTGLTSSEQQRNGDTSEGDQVAHHGGFVSSSGSIIYPPPPPPFMRFKDSAPSGTQPELNSLDDTSRHEKTTRKYKDAKEAAKAAAESAERAQIAAKAAAEMARHENNARGKARVEEDRYSIPDVGFVKDSPKQSVTKNITAHDKQVWQDFQSDEEEEEMATHITGPDRENEHVDWDKHETSYVAVFDQGDSDVDEYSNNLLDTLSQPKKEEYWREKSDSTRQYRYDSVFFEDSTKDSSPPRFGSGSAPTFDSDALSSDDEPEHDIKANEGQPRYIYGEEREEKVFASGLKNTGVSSDDENYEASHGLNFGKLTGGLKNKGYRRPPYVKKPITGATPSVETLHGDDDVYVSPRTKKPLYTNVHDAETSSVMLVETENNREGNRKSASRFDINYFDIEDELEEPESRQAQDSGRRANKNIIQQSRRTRDTLTSKIRNKDHFGENRDSEMSDEGTTTESAVAEKPELDEEQIKSSVPPSTSARSRRPPDYESLAAHFRSLRTNRP